MDQQRRAKRPAHRESSSSDTQPEFTTPIEPARGQHLAPGGNRVDVRPSPDDRCAECGQAVGDSWVSYRPDPADRENLVQHFVGFVNAGPAEPPADRPKSRIRDFRYPDDLGVFFHSWCAPKAKLPEKLQEEISNILAKCLVAHYRKMEERWVQVRLPPPGEDPAARCRAHVAGTNGRRVFTMARAGWERFRSHEGQLVEIELERVPAGGLAEPASAIAALAARCHVQTERIEVWRYTEQERPGPHNVHDYLVLENFTQKIHLPKFAERVSIPDTPNLRKHLRDHIFLVRARPDKGRWEPKARALERVVFLTKPA